MKGEHIVPVCLAPEVRSGIIKFCAKHDLDKTFACQLLIVKQLYNEKMIGQEAYELYVMRYSKRLVNADLEWQRLSIQEKTAKRAEQQKLDEETRYFEAILRSEWALHESIEWRRKVLARADLWKDKVKAARLVLALGVDR